MVKKLIPLAAMEKLLKEVGAERVSEEAKGELKRFLEEYGYVISKTAVKLADHAKRKTVKAKDVKLAVTQN